jgi:hypothetical protein
MKARAYILHNTTDTRELPDYDGAGNFKPRGEFIGYSPECRLQKAYEVTKEWPYEPVPREVAEHIFCGDNLGTEAEKPEIRSLSVGDVVVTLIRARWTCLVCEDKGWSEIDITHVLNSLLAETPSKNGPAECDGCQLERTQSRD